jgi:hypothetical protein
MSQDVSNQHRRISRFPNHLSPMKIKLIRHLWGVDLTRGLRHYLPQWREQGWHSQLARGFAISTLTPEFGPPPYLQTLPHTNVPGADLTKVCDWMAARQRQRFTSITTPIRTLP